MGLLESLLQILQTILCGPGKADDNQQQHQQQPQSAWQQPPGAAHEYPPAQHHPDPPTHQKPSKPYHARIDDNAQAQADPHYQELRSRAREEGDAMARAFDASQEAYQSGDGAGAKELSNEGKMHKAEMERLNKEASDWIFQQVNLDSAPDELDLHGLYVKEAIERTEAAVQAAQDRGDQQIRIIVGKGLHSEGRVAKLKPAIEELMVKYQLSAHVDPENAGVLIVQLGGHGQRGMDPTEVTRRLERDDESPSASYDDLPFAMGFFDSLLQIVQTIFGASGKDSQQQQQPPQPTWQQPPGATHQQKPAQHHPAPPTQQKPTKPSKPITPSKPKPYRARTDDNAEAQADPRYQELRSRAREAGDAMASAFTASKEVYQNGDRAKAKELSNEGKMHKAEMERLNKEASDWIFQQVNLDSAPDELDLHGLYVKEAIERTETAVEAARGRGDQQIRIIVGKGLHSEGRVAKLKPAIEELMVKYQLNAHIDPENAGVLIVQLGGRGHGGMDPTEVTRRLERDDGCVVT
ncbi:unnamed protein product [Rhizoctonia solani]|uniref:Smr domain-containing protein n=1 Tax=Rhizoctonia solani TaxID=456999 RepID=A0A8H3DQM6_9AGAM|nr:unnamed protein product [Rhizoctonia solani]